MKFRTVFALLTLLSQLKLEVYSERNFMKSFLVVLCVFFAGVIVQAKDQIIELKSTANGFEPEKIEVSSEEPVILKVTRTTDDTCATDIQVKDKKVSQKLPLNETVTINLGKLKKGEIKFNCSMNMFKGALLVK